MKQLGVVTLILLLFCMVADAARPDLARVTVSEPFLVGTTLMPAGDYQIRCDTQSRTATIAGRHGQSSSDSVTVQVAEILTQGHNESSYLIFVREQGKLVLHQFAIAGDNHIHDIVHANTAQELGK